MSAELKSGDRASTTKEALQTMALIVVAVMSILTSTGSATAMFWASLATLICLFFWFVAERKIWLAACAGMMFAITVIATASQLY